MSETHFGYERVATEDKVKLVGQVFSSVASHYDVMNDLMSFGLHRLWKRFAVEVAAVRPSDQILDLAGGTGDLTAMMMRKLGPKGRVTLADINADMLSRGRDRLMDQGLHDGLQFSLANAEYLPFSDESFNLLIIGFGLRNVTDKAAALREMHRVLKPGGRALVLEFSRPAALFKPAYDLYSFKILPQMGRLVARDANSYRYLAESIRMHPDQQTLKQDMETAGFDRCEYFNLSAGVVALHRGYRLS